LFPDLAKDALLFQLRITDLNATPPQQRNQRGRIIELDALRALAAINLMFFHFTHVYAVKYGYRGELGFCLPYGKYGVQLFFMLSGFVNTLTLARKRRAGDFLVNRILRIYPSFWIVVGLNVVLFAVAPISLGSFSTGQTAANLTALPNLFGFETMEPVTWTIQVELLFYGVVLLMFVSGSLDRPWRPIMGMLVLSAVARWASDTVYLQDPQSLTLAWLQFIRQLLILDYIPLFAIGMLLHQIYIREGQRWVNVVGVVLSAVVFHAIDRHDHNPMVTVMFIGLLTAAAYGKLPVLRLRFFVFISTISYALYLMHNNLGCVVIYHVNRAGCSPFFSMVLAIALMTGLAAVYTYRFEQPLTRLLKNVWQTRQPQWIQSIRLLTRTHRTRLG